MINASNCDCDLIGLTCPHSGKRAAHRAERKALQSETGSQSLTDSVIVRDNMVASELGEWARHHEIAERPYRSSKPNNGYMKYNPSGKSSN